MNEINTQASYNTSLINKVAVLSGTAIATSMYVASLAKKQNCAGKTLLHKMSNVEMGIKEGIELCTASTFGGLVTGLAIDKPETRKYKLKDTVNQLIGNTFIPFGCLAISNKVTKHASKIVQTVAGLATLVVTTFLGHDIANKTNEKLFKEKSGYKCSGKDIFTDADDILFTISTVLRNKTLYKMTAAICPITYLTNGYLAGTRQEDKKCEKKLDKII